MTGSMTAKFYSYFRRAAALLLLTCCGAARADDSVSLALDDAIRLALRQNLDMQTARERVTGADISVNAAQAKFKLAIRPNVSGLYQQNDELDQAYGLRLSKQFTTGGEASWETRTQVDDSDEAEDPYQTDLIFAYTQPLLRGRGARAATAQLASAERAARAQRRAFLVAQQHLIIRAASAYYGIVRDQMLLETHEQAVKRAQTLHAAAEAKLNVGMASKMDVFRAELQSLTAQNRLVDARAALENAKRQFNVLLGSPLDARYLFAAPLNYAPVALDLDELMRQALEHRLELQTAQEQIDEAERQLNIARQNLLPPLDVSVRYTLRGEGDGFRDSVKMEDEFWGVGVSSSFALNLAEERAAYQQAQLSLNAAIRARQATQDDILAEVMQTTIAVEQAQASVALQAQSVTQANKQLELAELRYKKGLSDNLDVLDAEENVMQANTGAYSAIAQHLIALLRLKQVTGTLEIPPE